MNWLIVISIIVVIIEFRTCAYIKEDTKYNKSDSDNRIYIEGKETLKEEHLRHKKIIVINKTPEEGRNRHFLPGELIVKKEENFNEHEEKEWSEKSTLPIGPETEIESIFTYLATESYNPENETTVSSDGTIDDLRNGFTNTEVVSLGVEESVTEHHQNLLTSASTTTNAVTEEYFQTYETLTTGKNDMEELTVKNNQQYEDFSGSGSGSEEIYYRIKFVQNNDQPDDFSGSGSGYYSEEDYYRVVHDTFLDDEDYIFDRVLDTTSLVLDGEDLIVNQYFSGSGSGSGSGENEEIIPTVGSGSGSGDIYIATEEVSNWEDKKVDWSDYVICGPQRPEDTYDYF